MQESLREKKRRERTKDVVVSPAELYMIAHNLPGFASQLDYVATHDLLGTGTRKIIN